MRVFLNEKVLLVRSSISQRFREKRFQRFQFSIFHSKVCLFLHQQTKNLRILLNFVAIWSKIVRSIEIFSSPNNRMIEFLKYSSMSFMSVIQLRRIRFENSIDGPFPAAGGKDVCEIDNPFLLTFILSPTSAGYGKIPELGSVEGRGARFGPGSWLM